MFVSLLVFMLLTLMTKAYDYDGSYYPGLPDVEQHMWYKDAYSFLYCDDGANYPYGVPGNNASPYNQNMDNGTPKYWLGDASRLYLIGSYENSANSYARAINLDPSSSMGWLNLGNSPYFLGRFQASLNAYNAVLRLDPN
jgi:tetratricopeptide (TPR) repeat protein